LVLDAAIAGALVIVGGLSGSLLLTLFDYFRGRKAYEEEIQAILAKPEANRTEEEKYKLTVQPQSFFQSYKFRLGFGVIVGSVTVLSMFDSIVSGIPTDSSALQVFIAGMTASGFFSAVADKIRAT
jgi:hypothetical protein